MLLQQQPGGRQDVGIVIDDKNACLRAHARTVAGEVFEIDHLCAIVNTGTNLLICKLLIFLGPKLAHELLL